MKQSAFASQVSALGAVLAVVFNTAAAYATTFPVVAVGDTFSGSISLDASTPCSPCASIYAYYLNPGTVTVNIGGAIFTHDIKQVSVFTSNGVPNNFWFASAEQYAFDRLSYSIAFPVFNTTTISLVGLDTPSTSILPLDLSSYTYRAWVVVNLHEIVGPYLERTVSYQGNITSMYSVPNGSLQNINFTAEIFSTGSVMSDSTPTPLPAALPLFVTGLGALGLLGWCRKRKVQAPS